MRHSKQATTKQPDDEDKASPLSAPFRTEFPHVIHTDGVYTVEDLRRVFGLKASSVRREVRLGRLRIAKRCGRYYCLGRWVLEWILDGELRRRNSQRDTSSDP